MQITGQSQIKRLIQLSLPSLGSLKFPPHSIAQWVSLLVGSRHKCVIGITLKRVHLQRVNWRYLYHLDLFSSEFLFWGDFFVFFLLAFNFQL